MIIKLGLLICMLFVRSVSANVVGADTQNFNPTNDGLDFVTVHSSKTLVPGLINMGLFFNYAVNSLPNFSDTTNQTRTNFRDTLLSSDFNIGVGLAKNWEVGISFPYVLSQSVKTDLTTYRGQFTSTGMTEYRLMVKNRLVGSVDRGIAAIVSANFNQIDNNPFLGRGAGPTLNFELAGDMRIFRKVQWGLNGGYRLRSPGEAIPGVPIEPLGSQYIASTALSYLMTSLNTKIIGEIFGSMPAQKGRFESDRQSGNAEMLLGFKSDISRAVAFHFGGGTELVHGTSAPDWRVYTGINWVIGPVFDQPKQMIVKLKARRVRPIKKDAPAPLPEPQELNDLDPFAGKPQMQEMFVARDVLFEFDKVDLKDGAHELLQKLADHLNRPPGFKTLSIEGHTDYIGTDEYNQDLSERRAKRVMDELLALGLPATKLKAAGFGANRPIANNGNYQGRALNRRVEFHVQR